MPSPRPASSTPTSAITVFYPLPLLAALLPLWLVYWLFVITLTTLAGYGMYRLTAFQAVLINPPGPFQVELDYCDPAVWWLHIGIMAGLGLIIGSTLYLRKSDLSSDAAIPGLKEPRGPVPIGRFSWPTAISGVIATFFWIGTLVTTAKVTLKDYNVVNLLTVGVLLSL